jgi:hypothetical protein
MENAGQNRLFQFKTKKFSPRLLGALKPLLGQLLGYLQVCNFPKEVEMPKSVQVIVVPFNYREWEDRLVLEKYGRSIQSDDQKSLFS